MVVHFALQSAGCEACRLGILIQTGSGVLHSFPAIAVTNYHKLGGFKHGFLIL